ncbi:heavy-metal-associated domain-containing protein [Aestuariivivens marinum]|uniref:heavy-metal-associated domain-containing protein n=1 Tax=Aestuariivivens marinum TaxID=2913555 RepID=UPI001F5915A0|nr:heavy metal-associated domain-containing protein [Aestuariivivens marinum]
MKATLEVQNLKCGGCASTIETRLSGLEHITEVLVNIDDFTVTFLYQDETNLTQAKELLAKLGYPVVGGKNALTTKARSFVSCAAGRMTK